jgi:hypothetical protein
MEKYAVNCKKCGCLFVPGGSETTAICVGCYKAELEKTLELLKATKTTFAIIATAGHHTGYDWNADCKKLTLVQGEASGKVDAALLRYHRSFK